MGAGSDVSVHLMGEMHVTYLPNPDLYVIRPKDEYLMRVTIKGDDALALAREIVRVAEMRPAIEEVK
jgi:hypothetical protein